MNILIIGSGGREHALAWKISQSPQCSKLFVAPGNAGTKEVAQNVDLHPDDFQGLRDFCLDNAIGLVVVGPEDPLVNGIRDFLESSADTASIPIVGPGKAGARLEGSKDFSKEFMNRHGIPTANARTFSQSEIKEASGYLDTLNPPFVLKADGLAAGKGVIISHNREEARAVLSEILLKKRFGEAGSRVLIEDYLEGIELSVFVLTDGTNYVILPEAKDYKRIGAGDTGPNTGGMGAVSPVPFADQRFMKAVEEGVIKPTINGLRTDAIPYKGFIFIGLMNVKGHPYVIEYNVRMGDPETQVVLPRIKSDLVVLLHAAATGTLKNRSVEMITDFAVTTVLVSGGYPGTYDKNKAITGLNRVTAGVVVFHAGTMQKNGTLVTNGGRVLAVTGIGKSLQEARSKAYKGVSNIHWEGLYYRNDIGEDLMPPD